MKNWIRNLVGALMLGAISVSLMVPAAEAGGRWNRGNARNTVRVEFRGGWPSAGFQTRGGGYERGYARVSSHPAHRYFGGLFYCSGKTADGCWKSGDRCEDDWGNRKVDNPEWVSWAKNQCGHGGGYEQTAYDRRW